MYCAVAIWFQKQQVKYINAKYQKNAKNEKFEDQKEQKKDLNRRDVWILPF